MSTDIHKDDDCPGCGATLHDREKKADSIKREFGDDVSTDLTECQFCGSMKCVMCDMGDDVECGSCNEGDDE